MLLSNFTKQDEMFQSHDERLMLEHLCRSKFQPNATFCSHDHFGKFEWFTCVIGFKVETEMTN